MKSLCIALIWLLAPAAVKAQSDTVRWTIEECVAYALEHSAAVKRTELAVKAAKMNVSQRTAEFLPSLSAQSSAQWAWGRNIDPETNSYNDVTTFNNNYGLYASLTLFDGCATYNAWRQAKADRQRSMSEAQKAKDDKAFEVMQAYIDASYCEGSVELAKERLKESRSLLHLAKRQEEVGLKSAPEVATVEAQVAEDEYNLINKENKRNTANNALRKAMNCPTPVIPYGLDNYLAHGFNGFNGLASEEKGKNLLNPLNLCEKKKLPCEIGSADEILRIADLNVKSARLAYLTAKGHRLPSLSVSAGVATNFFRNLTADYQAPAFSTQFKNNMGEYLSASISIPIFDNLYRHTATKRARLNWLAAKADREEAQLALEIRRRQATDERNGCLKELASLEKKVAADSLAYSLNKRRYEEGLLSAIDLRTSANALSTSQLSLLQQQKILIIKEIMVEYYGQKD